jgi:hypothetical protein
MEEVGGVRREFGGKRWRRGRKEGHREEDGKKFLNK